MSFMDNGVVLAVGAAGLVAAASAARAVGSRAVGRCAGCDQQAPVKRYVITFSDVSTQPGKQERVDYCSECADLAKWGWTDEISAIRSAPRGSSARSSRGFTLNDKDRGEWIDNDEGLYNWWRRSRMSKREFIKQNRAEIDNAIYGVPGMGHFRR